jgi:uracil-DNA glycosylase
LQWALSYDGYLRMAASPEALREVLRPAMAEYAVTGRVPEWCGVDFLRAWAFYRQREHNHVGHGPIAQDFYDVLEAVRGHAAAKKADLPPARSADLPVDWSTELRASLEAPYWSELMEYVSSERQRHEVVPSAEQTFRAFELTPFDDVRVVILGQDPYPTPGNADGLAFSVSNPSAKTPDSLRNVFAEVAADVGAPKPTSNSLAGWAQQGVLLLNTALTLRVGDKDDHAAHRQWRWKRQGWHTFTDAVISRISARDLPVVFILWGADARKKAKLIDTDRHLVIEQVHPSQLSARKGFFGSKPFSQANEFLRQSGRGTVDWARTA